MRLMIKMIRQLRRAEADKKVTEIKMKIMATEMVEVEMERDALLEIVTGEAKCETCHWGFLHNSCGLAYCEKCPDRHCDCFECKKGSKWRWKGI